MNNRNKKGLILLSLFIVLNIFLLTYLIYDSLNTKKIDTSQTTISIVDEVYTKINNDKIDLSFVKWVDTNYKGSLDKLNQLLDKNPYNINMWHEVTGYSYIVLYDLYNEEYNNLSNIKTIESNNPSVLSFVGDISLADNWYIAKKYDERAKGIEGILSKEVLKIMNESDLMVVNSEFTVSNRGTKIPNKAYTFRANPERLSIYYDMGVDLVTLANNHVYDYGKDAFLDMLDSFDEYNIPHIGAGHNLDEAKTPYYFIINGYKIALISATRAEKNILTPGATETSEGVFRCYDPTNLVEEIKKIKEDSDYVIAIIHYGKEYSHKLEKEQIESSKMYIDAGADAVIGHHAHVLQGVEFYNSKPIIYNLGNFIFDNETVDTAIFQIILNDNGSLEFYFIPAIQKNEYTDILTGSERKRVINNLNSWSVNAKIDDSGKITKI